MAIRLENQKDYLEAETLVREAFWNVDQPGCDEHLVVHKLRDDPSFIKDLTYVMKEGGIIVAAIYYAIGALIDEKGNHTKGLLCGPIAVHPKWQQQGVGPILIEFTMQKAAELEYPYILITSNPLYYARFGFTPAFKNEIHLEGIDNAAETPFFMMKILDESKKIPAEVFHHPSCYSVFQEDVEQFDKMFPYQEKRVLSGQLR